MTSQEQYTLNYMDIQLKKKAWYVRFRYHIMAGAVFLAFAIHVAILAFGPTRQIVDRNDCKIAEVLYGDFTEYIDVQGIVQPIQTIQINALESGFVEAIMAEEGAMLEVGDTILILSNPELLRSIETERAEWENNQRHYREQEIEMEQRSIMLRQQVLEARHLMSGMDKSLQQSREEYRMGIKSKAELEVAEEEYAYQHQKAEMQIESLKHDSVATIIKHEMVEANRRATDKKLTHATQRTANLVVRAAVAGQLSYLNATIGQQVAAGSSICSIKVMSQYKVHTSLSEYYIDRITTGLPANIIYQNKVFPLRISKVVPEVQDRNFECDLIFTADKPSNIRLGKNYRVQIELDKPERALILSRGDFYPSTSGKWIYRLAPNGRTAHRVEIELGRQNTQQYEVLSGLDAGDKVIISGYDKFNEKEELIIK